MSHRKLAILAAAMALFASALVPAGAAAKIRVGNAVALDGGHICLKLREHVGDIGRRALFREEPAAQGSAA